MTITFEQPTLLKKAENDIDAIQEQRLNHCTQYTNLIWHLIIGLQITDKKSYVLICLRLLLFYHNLVTTLTKLHTGSRLRRSKVFRFEMTIQPRIYGNALVGGRKATLVRNTTFNNIIIL